MQNATLHNLLKKITYQYLNDKNLRILEKETNMQKNFDIRMSMDQILRKTIRNFDNEYKQKAIVKMHEEAHLVKLDNNKLVLFFNILNYKYYFIIEYYRLMLEFARREETCSSLIKQQQQSFEHMMKSKVELEVIETSTLLQEQLVHSLEKQQIHEEK